MAKNEETAKTPEELLEEAKAQAAAILEEAEKQAAEKLKEAEKAAKPARNEARAQPELVSIRLFKDTERYKDDLKVAINGKNWVIQRGVTVMVPDYVAQFIEQSLKQDLDTAMMLEKRQKEFKDETEARGL